MDMLEKLLQNLNEEEKENLENVYTKASLWTKSLLVLLINKGIITENELDETMTKILKYEIKEKKGDNYVKNSN